MTRPCPTKDEILLLVNGELAQNRATKLNQHVTSCSDCQLNVELWKQLQRGIAAGMPGLEPEDAGRSVMRRIRSTETETPSSSWPRAWYAVLGSTIIAAAVALVVLQSTPVVPGSVETFQPRSGSAKTELARKVGLDFFVMREGVLTKLSENARISGTEGLTLSYINSVRKKKIYMVAFVLDAEQEVHWLYPAYMHTDTDPLAIELPTNNMETVLPETIELDAPALGPANLIWIASFNRLSVSSIETLTKLELSPMALRKRWPKAEVGNLRARLER